MAVVGALMIGGIIAAPIAAWLVQKVHARLMGVLVGGLIILVNTRTLVHSWINQTALYPAIYIGIIAVWISAIVYIVVKIRTSDQTAQALNQ